MTKKLRGEVFAVRLNDAENELVQKAISILKRNTHMAIKVTKSNFIRVAVVAEANKIIEKDKKGKM